MTDRIEKLSLQEFTLELDSLVLPVDADPAQDTVELPFSPYIAAAAVLAYYDPNLIRPALDVPLKSTQQANLLQELVGYSTLMSDATQLSAPETRDHKSGSRGGSYKLYYSLRDDVRRQALLHLSTTKALPGAMAANPEVSRRTDMPLQAVLTSVLEGRLPALPELSVPQLHALGRVYSWCRELPGSVLPSQEEIAARIELAEMLLPMKHLTGDYVDGAFHERFRGRQAELATLRRYVGVAPPAGIKEHAVRLWDTVTGILSGSKRNPMLLFGIGGIGKSTLVAKFILEHAEAHKKDRFPFVYLDFDRPQLSALEPQTLLIEASRQLAIQYRDIPFVAASFRQFHIHWSARYVTLLHSSTSERIVLQSHQEIEHRRASQQQIGDEYSGLMKLLSEHESKPFLMVLDTFEEVQYKGAEYVDVIFEFMDELRRQYNHLRVVIAGRAPVRNHDTHDMELKNLDQEAATGYLLGAGINLEQQARLIARRVGGNPLSLKLAAELVKKDGPDALESIAGGDDSAIQGKLYDRILLHLHNPQVRKLAHPGLVLRRITPELILEVLSAPCDLGIKDMQEAKLLFDETSREVSLVTQKEPGVLKHRADVRKVMLRLIMGSKKRDLAMAIHKLAAGYYAGREGRSNRAEEFYHRLASGESPRALDDRWIEGMEDLLTGSRDELPEPAQAYILAKAGIETGEDTVWEAADQEDLDRRFIKQAASLLNSGFAEKALDLLQKAIPGKTSYTIVLLRVRALWQMEEKPEAAEMARSALQSIHSDDIPFKIIHELERYAAWVAVPQDAPSEVEAPPSQSFEDFGNDDLIMQI